MPTVLRNGPYRLFFYAGDRNEPEHVHISRDNLVAKFWLNPIRLAKSGRFRPAEIGWKQTMVDAHQEILLETWHEYFGD